MWGCITLSSRIKFEIRAYRFIIIAWEILKQKIHRVIRALVFITAKAKINH